MRLAGTLLLVLLSAGLSGCWSTRKKQTKLPPPPPPPVVVMPAPQPKVELPPEATTPIPVQTPPQQPDVTVIKPDLPRPPKKDPKAPPKPAPRKPVATPPPSNSIPTPPSDTPAAPTPQLGELISAERRVELVNELEQSLDRARGTLSIAAQRPLSRRQSETAARIRTFIRQAEDAKSRDISTAVQLARRADLLAQDLAATFR